MNYSERVEFQGIRLLSFAIIAVSLSSCYLTDKHPSDSRVHSYTRGATDLKRTGLVNKPLDKRVLVGRKSSELHPTKVNQHYTPSKKNTRNINLRELHQKIAMQATASNSICQQFNKEIFDLKKFRSKRVIEDFSLLPSRFNDGYFFLKHENQKILVLVGKYLRPNSKKETFVALGTCKGSDFEILFKQEFFRNEISFARPSRESSKKLIDVVITAETEDFGWIKYDNKKETYVFELFHDPDL